MPDIVTGLNLGQGCQMPQQRLMLLVGASAGAERKLKQRAGARHQVDLAVTLQSPSEKAASTASGGGGAGNPPGLAQAKNLLVHFQRLWA